MSKLSLINQYKSLVEDGKLNNDPYQKTTIAKLNELSEELSLKKENSFLSRLSNFARIGDYIEFFSEIDLLAGLSACPGGDCSLSHSSDDAVCYSIKVEIYECLNNDLKNWREPETSNYSGDHKN